VGRGSTLQKPSYYEGRMRSNMSNVRIGRRERWGLESLFQQSTCPSPTLLFPKQKGTRSNAGGGVKRVGQTGNMEY
jgi:hypothetical protein